MLFNSTAFLLVFLPIALTGSHLLGRFGSRQSQFIRVVGMSMVFCGVRNPVYVPLLLGSITANYLIANRGFDRVLRPGRRRLLLVAGIGLNLSLPGAFTPYGSLLSDYEMKEPADAQAERVVVERVKTHLVKRPLEHSPHLQAYRDMLADLRNRNIAVCMVEYPVTPIHRRIVADMAPEYPAIRQRFQALAREFGATYKSYWSSMDDYRLYRNADHLNRHGAAALTPILMNNCGIGPVRQAAAPPPVTHGYARPSFSSRASGVGSLPRNAV